MQTKHVSFGGKLKYLIIPTMFVAGFIGRESHIGENEVEIIYETSQSKSVLVGKNIVILPGHGGTSPKGESDTGAKYTQDEKIYFEKDIALQTAKTLKIVLEQNGAKVFMSREEDKYLSSKEQALFANKQNPHVIISLHTNKAKDKDISGVELWGYKSCDVDLLQEIYDLFSLDPKLSVRSPRLNKWDVVKKTNRPAVLIEMGFLKDVSKMIRPEFQQHFSQKLKLALENYFRNHPKAMTQCVHPAKKMSIKKPFVFRPHAIKQDKQQLYRLARGQ